MSLEFRVRWQREGRAPTYRIYQSWEAACRKVRAVAALEAVKGDFPQYDGMEDLIGPPMLQAREVGVWAPHDHQPDPSDYDEQRMREHAKWTQPAAPETASGIPF